MESDPGPIKIFTFMFPRSQDTQVGPLEYGLGKKDPLPASFREKQKNILLKYKHLSLHTAQGEHLRQIIFSLLSHGLCHISFLLNQHLFFRTVFYKNQSRCFPNSMLWDFWGIAHVKVGLIVHQKILVRKVCLKCPPGAV